MELFIVLVKINLTNGRLILIYKKIKDKYNKLNNTPVFKAVD